MDNRIKELIAIGASITANCQPCLNYHVSAARQAGADEKEINMAIEVAKTVRNGAAGKMDQFASMVLDQAETVVSASEKGCGCGCE